MDKAEITYEVIRSCSRLVQSGNACYSLKKRKMFSEWRGQGNQCVEYRDGKLLEKHLEETSANVYVAQDTNCEFLHPQRLSIYTVNYKDLDVT